MTMNFRSFLVLSAFVLQFSCGQTDKENVGPQEFPFTAENWKVENADGAPSEISTRIFKNKSAIELTASQVAYLTGNKFKNFKMEFYCNGAYPGVGFRIQDKKNYEYLYLRVPSGTKRDALQYIPIFNGSLPWQLYNYPKYEGEAAYPLEKIVFPLTIEKLLIKGKVSENLLQQLAKKSISFSRDAEIFVEDATKYIYDPNSKKALLFETNEDTVVFSDFRTWIHTKIEVIGNEMAVYVGDMKTPTFVVSDLKREPQEGGISLISDFGEVYFTEVSVQELENPGRIKDQSSKEKLSDNYLTKWKISEMFTKDSLNFSTQLDSILQYKNEFDPVYADEDGLVNISRFYDDMTKTVVLSCTLESETDSMVQLDFDYADHLVIFLNSKIIFDKGMNFQPPENKGMEGRVFVDDEDIILNLKKGNNQLHLMLSADNRQQFNWGLIAKLENLKGISLE